ncbi:putative DNA-directed RNA polymerase V subunit 5A [Iris pallida]|uniref:DNA-directed RNA polymerase V subunit 5A n=1 Tax=Iris pallida TaxID=29817 RepID=A0AAX6E8G8_IRIPA|nr:putative DNA-directed RNA polymerase V subunit 5A [Iris pallida]
MEKGDNGAPAMATTSMMEVEVEEEEEVNPCLSMMTDRGSVESQRYYLARRTLLEMLWTEATPSPLSTSTCRSPTSSAAPSARPPTSTASGSPPPFSKTPPRRFLAYFVESIKSN